MSEERNKVIKTKWIGALKIADVEIPCAVLPSGERVIWQRAIFKAFGGGRPGGRQWKKRSDEAEADVVVPVFLTASNLKPFISENLLWTSSNPYLIQVTENKIAHAIEATALPEICEVWLKARDKGNVLLKRQEHFAVIADMLMRGLAHVGIQALVDEATGYQEVRVRDALQKILEKYLTEEWARWTKTFPDEFYEELFRVYGVPFDPENMKRPSYVGHWTNDIVYSRLAPKVLDRLRELNPKLPTGRRARAFHQHLTRDHGYQELQKHLHAVIALLKATRDGKRGNFERMLAQAFPEVNKTFELPLDEDS